MQEYSGLLVLIVPHNRLVARLSISSNIYSRIVLTTNQFLACQYSYTGTLETDLLLGQFANRYLMKLKDEQLDDYEALLAQGDQNILAWVRGDLQIPANLNGMVFSLIKDFSTKL